MFPRILYLLTGASMIILAIGGYPTEIYRLREALVSGWVAAGTAGERAQNAHERWIRAFARRVLGMLRWLFGPRLLSARSFWVGLALSQASSYFWLSRATARDILVHQRVLDDSLPEGISEDIWRRYAELYGPGTSAVASASAFYAALGIAFVLASGLPASLQDVRRLNQLPRAAVVMLGSATALNTLTRGFIAAIHYIGRGLWYPPYAILVVPLFGIPINILLVAMLTWCARRTLASSRGEITHWFVIGVFSTVAPIYMLGALTRWAWRNLPPGHSIPMTLARMQSLHEGIFAVGSIFLSFGLALLLHRVAWGAVTRPIYVLHNVTFSRVALGGIGVALLAAYDPQVGDVAKRIVFTTLGIRPLGASP